MDMIKWKAKLKIAGNRFRELVHTGLMYGFVQYKDHGNAEVLREVTKLRRIPPNLRIRLSAPMIDRAPPKWWKYTSTVSTGTKPVHGRNRCPAPQQDHKCGDCRKCWGATLNIDYGSH